MKTVERARGRWREILPRLGIETRFLSNKQGPCPFCGGKTRFRFDDKEGNGTWYCNQCIPHAGAGLHLIRKLHGWDYATACREVDNIIRTDRPTPRAKPAAHDGTRRLALIQRLLREAEHPEIVDAYLRRRGLSVTSPALCGHPRLPYYDNDGRFVGLLPAVLAPIIGPAAGLESAIRIYDADVAHRKKTLPPVTTINGAAIRLYPAEDELGIAEGVETALAAYELFGIPTWAAISSHGIQSFVPPLGLRRLTVFADHDSNFVGQTAAYELAGRIAKEGLTVEVRVPPIVNTDWLDFLKGQQPP